MPTSKAADWIEMLNEHLVRVFFSSPTFPRVQVLCDSSECLSSLRLPDAVGGPVTILLSPSSSELELSQLGLRLFSRLCELKASVEMRDATSYYEMMTASSMGYSAPLWSEMYRLGASIIKGEIAFPDGMKPKITDSFKSLALAVDSCETSEVAREESRVELEAARTVIANTPAIDGATEATNDLVGTFLKTVVIALPVMIAIKILLA